VAEQDTLLSKAKHVLTEHGSPRAQRAALVVFCLAIFLPSVFRGFVDPDETRYAEITREMLERGDWVIPHLNYVPYFMKPPLTYWVAAISVKLFGFHPWVLRLGPLLAAILGVLATYEMGAAIGSRRTGLIAGAILATSIEYYALAVFFMTDMLFSAFLFVAWLAFWRHYQESGRRRAWIALFWLCAGLACFTKGPLGPALLFFTIVIFLILRRDWNFLGKMRPVTGLAIFAAVNLPWAILVYHHDPRFVTFFYWRVNAAGVSDAALQHSEPFYYYLSRVPLGLFPWTLLAIAAIVAAATVTFGPARKTAPAGQVWLTSLFLGGVILLSIPKAKLATYSLPLFSAAAVITADYLARIDGRSRVARFLVPLQCLVAMSALMVFLLGWEMEHFKVSAFRLSLCIALAAGLASAVALLFAAVVSFRGRLGAGMWIMGISAAIIFPIAMILLPRVASGQTSEVLCRRFRAELAAADLIVVSQAKDFSVPLFVGRRVAVVGHASELGMGLFVENQPAHLPIPNNPFQLKAGAIGSKYLLGIQELVTLWSSSSLIYLFASEKFLDKFLPLCPNVWTVGSNGHTTLLTNRDPAITRRPQRVMARELSR